MPAITDLPIWQDERIIIISQGTATTTPTTYTYNGSMDKYIFRNDGGSSITLTINAVAVTVTAGESVSGGSLSSFTVTASSGSIPYTIRAYDATQNNATIKSSSGTELNISNVGTIGDGVSLSNQGLTEASIQYGWNGASYDRIRVPNVYKYQNIATFTGSTAYTIWTPASGKKFRLMGVSVVVTAASKVSLRDGTAGSGTAFHTFGVAVAGDTYTFNFGNGYLSSAANNVLELYNISATSAAFITVFGTEE